MDGTLTDPAEGITKAVEVALNHYGITVENRSTLNKFIGPPLDESFPEFYGFNDEQVREATRYSGSTLAARAGRKISLTPVSTSCWGI